jgi:hypothetical protein
MNGATSNGIKTSRKDNSLIMYLYSNISLSVKIDDE